MSHPNQPPVWTDQDPATSGSYAGRPQHLGDLDDPHVHGADVNRSFLDDAFDNEWLAQPDDGDVTRQTAKPVANEAPAEQIPAVHEPLVHNKRYWQPGDGTPTKGQVTTLENTVKHIGRGFESGFRDGNRKDVAMLAEWTGSKPAPKVTGEPTQLKRAAIYSPTEGLDFTAVAESYAAAKTNEQRDSVVREAVEELQHKGFSFDNKELSTLSATIGRDLHWAISIKPKKGNQQNPLKAIGDAIEDYQSATQRLELAKTAYRAHSGLYQAAAKTGKVVKNVIASPGIVTAGALTRIASRLSPNTANDPVAYERGRKFVKALGAASVVTSIVRGATAHHHFMNAALGPIDDWIGHAAHLVTGGDSGHHGVGATAGNAASDLLHNNKDSGNKAAPVIDAASPKPSAANHSSAASPTPEAGHTTKDNHTTIDNHVPANKKPASQEDAGQAATAPEAAKHSTEWWDNAPQSEQKPLGKYNEQTGDGTIWNRYVGDKGYVATELDNPHLTKPQEDYIIGEILKLNEDPNNKGHHITWDSAHGLPSDFKPVALSRQHVQSIVHDAIEKYPDDGDKSHSATGAHHSAAVAHDQSTTPQDDQQTQHGNKHPVSAGAAHEAQSNNQQGNDQNDQQAQHGNKHPVANADQDAKPSPADTNDNIPSPKPDPNATAPAVDTIPSPDNTAVQNNAATNKDLTYMVDKTIWTASRKHPIITPAALATTLGTLGWGIPVAMKALKDQREANKARSQDEEDEDSSSTLLP